MTIFSTAKCQRRPSLWRTCRLITATIFIVIITFAAALDVRPVHAAALPSLLDGYECSGRIVRADIGSVLQRHGERDERLHDVVLEFITMYPTDTSSVIELSAQDHTTYYPDLKAEMQYFRPWVEPREFVGITHIAVPESRLGSSVRLTSEINACTSAEASLVTLVHMPLIARIQSAQANPSPMVFSKANYSKSSNGMQARQAPQGHTSSACIAIDHPPRTTRGVSPDASQLPDAIQQISTFGTVQIAFDADGNELTGANQQIDG